MSVSLGVMVGVCLQLAAAPQVEPLFLPTTAFTLVWEHTIEKVRWEEDYLVFYDQSLAQPRLYASAARIKGSAAGMEPPPEAVHKDGWYHYVPAISFPSSLALTRSEFSADYDWCDTSGCKPLSSKMPRDGDVTLLSACQDPAVILPTAKTEFAIY